MLFMVNVLSHSGGGVSLDYQPWYLQLYDAIVNGFGTLIDGVSTIIDYISSLVYDLGLIVYYTSYFLLHIPQYLGFLPSVVISALLLGFGVAVTYLIVNRK